MADLARRVHSRCLVALSNLQYGNAQVPEEEAFLIIEEIEDVELFDAQLGVDPKLNVPAALQDTLFGEPEPSEEERAQYGQDIPPMGTYAILDSAKMPYLLTAQLSGSGLEYQSLFQGITQEELKERAPYLVKLEESHPFIRKLFTDLDPPFGLWRKELGIFIRSRADLKTLRNHFRKFVRISDKQGKWYYFRFWEKNIMRTYGECIYDKPERIGRWFITQEGCHIGFVVPIYEEKKFHYLYPSRKLENAMLNTPFLLGDVEIEAFTLLESHEFRVKLLKYLCEKSPLFNKQEKHRKEEIVIFIIKQAEKYNIRIHKALADFSLASVLLKSPLENVPVLREILESDNHPLDKANLVLKHVRSSILTP